MGKDLSIGIVGDASQAKAALSDFFDLAARGSSEARRLLQKGLGGQTEIEAKIVFRDDGSGKKIAQVIEREINPAADKLIRNYVEANKLQDGSLSKLRQQVNEAKQTRDAIARIAVTTDQYGKTIAVTNQQWVIANQRVAALSKALEQAGASSFWSRLKSDLNLQGLLNFGQGISQAVNIFQSLAIIIQQVTGFVNQFSDALKQIQSTELTFQAIGQGLEGASVALSESSRISLNLGVDLKTVRQGFQQLSPAILQSGGSLEDVSKITQALSSRFAVFGKSADESKRIMNGVIQAFGKGKLMAEELNQQISEADPAFRVDLANAIGVSVQKLNEMVKAGEVTSSVLLKVLPLLDKSKLIYGKLGTSALDAAKAVATGNVTIAQAEAKIAALNQLSLEQFGEQFKKVSAIFKGFGAVFVDFISGLSKTEAIKTLALVLEAIGGTILEITNVVLQAILVLIKAIDPILKIVNTLLEFKPIMIAVGAAVVLFASTQLVSLVAASVAASRALAAQAAATLGLTAAQGAGTAAAGAYAASQALVATPIKTLANLFGGLGATITSALTKPLPLFSKMGGAAGSLIPKQVLLTNAFTKFGTESANALRNGATNLGTFATAVGQTRIRLDQQAAAMAAVKSNLKDILLGFAAFAVIAGVVATVATVWDTYSKTVEKANEVKKSNINIATSMTDSYDGLRTELQAGNAAWEGAIERVGRFQATIDIFRRFLGLTTVDQAALAQELDASRESFLGVQEAAAGGEAELEKLAKSSKTAQEKIAEGQPVYTTLINGIDQVISRNNAKIKALQESTFATEEERKAAVAIIEEMTRQNAALEINKDALLLRAKALGLNVAASDAVTNAIDAEVKKLEEQGNAIKEVAQAEIDAARNAEKAALIGPEKRKTALEAKYKEDIDNITKLKEAEKSRWELEKRNIDANKTGVKRYYDDQLERLNRVLAAENAIYDARIAALTGPTPAESQLKALEVSKLKKEAAQGETQEDRLRAQAQLERIEREKQIDKIKAEQAANQKRREAEQQQIEDERTREERRIENEARDAEIAHKDKINKLEEDERKKKDTYNANLKAVEEEIARIKETATATVQKWEALIEQSNNNIAKAKWEQLQATGGALTKEEFITTELEKQRNLLVEINRLRNDGGVTTPTPTGGAPKGPTPAQQKQQQQRQRQATPPIWDAFKFIAGLASGGPTTGGTTYRVNELGQEAFLSRSGKLSYINAPAWGEWTAPGAGTVIPAHITAGLDIPSGGIRANTGAAAAVGSSSTGRDNSLSQMLGAALRSPQGRVTNNVTIQSANTTKAASDILVELTKIKRNRYR
jgi:tape measure domain-containing protein